MLTLFFLPSIIICPIILIFLSLTSLSEAIGVWDWKGQRNVREATILSSCGSVHYGQNNTQIENHSNGLPSKCDYKCGDVFYANVLLTPEYDLRSLTYYVHFGECEVLRISQVYYVWKAISVNFRLPQGDAIMKRCCPRSSALISVYGKSKDMTTAYGFRFHNNSRDLVAALTVDLNSYN